MARIESTVWSRRGRLFVLSMAGRGGRAGLRGAVIAGVLAITWAFAAPAEASAEYANHASATSSRQSVSSVAQRGSQPARTATDADKHSDDQGTSGIPSGDGNSTSQDNSCPGYEDDHTSTKPVSQNHQDGSKSDDDDSSVPTSAPVQPQVPSVTPSVESVLVQAVVMREVGSSAQQLIQSVQAAPTPTPAAASEPTSEPTSPPVAEAKPSIAPLRIGQAAVSAGMNPFVLTSVVLICGSALVLMLTSRRVLRRRH